MLPRLAHDLGIEVADHDAGLVGQGGADRPPRVEEAGVPAVGVALGLADPVDAEHPGLAVHGARRKQGAPGFGAPGGPVGDDDEEVGRLGGRAEELREAEVITDQGRDPDALDLDRRELVARLVVLGLAGEREGVDLAVMEDLVAVGREDAAGVGRPGLPGLGVAAEQPDPVGGRRAGEEGADGGGVLGHLVGSHRKSGGEHLGKGDDPRSLLGGLLQERCRPREARGGVLPGDVELNARDDQGAAPSGPRDTGSAPGPGRVRPCGAVAGADMLRCIGDLRCCSSVACGDAGSVIMSASDG